MTRAHVLAFLMEHPGTEKKLLQTFGREVQEIISSLRDLNLVCSGHNRIGVLHWYVVRR